MADKTLTCKRFTDESIFTNSILIYKAYYFTIKCIWTISIVDVWSLLRSLPFAKDYNKSSLNKIAAPLLLLLPLSEMRILIRQNCTRYYWPGNAAYSPKCHIWLNKYMARFCPHKVEEDEKWSLMAQCLQPAQWSQPYLYLVLLLTHWHPF